MVCIYKILCDHTLMVKEVLVPMMFVEISLSHEKMTPRTSTHAPFSSTEQSVTHSVTPPRPSESAPASD